MQRERFLLHFVWAWAFCAQVLPKGPRIAELSLDSQRDQRVAVNLSATSPEYYFTQQAIYLKA